MKWIHSFSVTLGALVIGIVLCSETVFGQTVGVIPLPVDHPITIPIEGRTQYHWRQGTGEWGETLSREHMARQGYETHNVKTPGGRGIDYVAVKRDLLGNLTDCCFVEVKTNRTAALSLDDTNSGPQMSRQWLAKNLRAMRASGDPAMRNLAREIAHFRKAQGVPIEALGEIHHINLASKHFSRINPVTSEVLATEHVEGILKQLQRDAGRPEIRRWATVYIPRIDEIQKTRMRQWLGQKDALSPRQVTALRIPSQMSYRFAERAVLPRVGGTATSRSLQRVAARAAGPIGIAVAVTLDVYEISSHVFAYQRGDISQRQMVIAVARSGGGIIGGVAGAQAGAVAGAWVGAFGGPFVWLTVPAGAVAGATIGGVVGYYGGSTVTGTIAEVWYVKVDERIKERIDTWIVSTDYKELVSQPL